jgi:ABC-2 type transport system ATP-binding protein
MSTPALKISHLHKKYDDLVAVKDISIEIQKGEFYGFLGQNGAGKSTTIHCITGLANPTSGTIEVFGHDNKTEYQKARRLIGLSQQDIHMDPYFTIDQALMYSAGYFGVPKEEAKKRTEKLLKQFGVWDKRDESYRKLSGGMKRKVEIAKALIHEPKILILDEPTAGLDVQTRRELWEYIKKRNKQGLTVILTTHYIEEAEEMCDRIGIIKKGELIVEKPTKELLKGNKKLEDVFVEITGEKS